MRHRTGPTPKRCEKIIVILENWRQVLLKPQSWERRDRSTRRPSPSKKLGINAQTIPTSNKREQTWYRIVQDLGQPAPKPALTPPYPKPRTQSLKLHTPHLTPYTLYLTPYTLHPTPYTLHLTPFTLYLTPYTLCPTPYTLHPTPYNLHLTPFTLHPTPYTLNPTPLTAYLPPLPPTAESPAELSEAHACLVRKSGGKAGGDELHVERGAVAKDCGVRGEG